MTIAATHERDVPVASAVAAPPTVRRRSPAWWQAAPMTVVFALFFILPLIATLVVSFWDYTEYSLIPAFTGQNYSEMFRGCLADLPRLCTTFATYVSTFKFAALTWAITAALGFAIAYFLAFHVRTLEWQVALFLLCTIPFWTSNVIRMISWIPLLGRNGVVNTALMDMGLTDGPLDWLLYSPFAVTLAFVHLYTLFMMVPIFNSMMRIDPALIEAARDAGASGWQTVREVILPLSLPGIVIGSIFVVTIVMGDFLTIGVMGGQQIASVGKVIQVEMSYLQFPAAAAQAVVLLTIVLLMVWGMTRLVDIRREL